MTKTNTTNEGVATQPDVAKPPEPGSATKHKMAHQPLLSKRSKKQLAKLESAFQEEEKSSKRLLKSKP